MTSESISRVLSGQLLAGGRPSKEHSTPESPIKNLIGRRAGGNSFSHNPAVVPNISLGGCGSQGTVPALLRVTKD